MKILAIGGVIDGKRMEMSTAPERYVLSSASESGPIKHVYRLVSLKGDNRTVFFYLHSNFTMDGLLEALIGKYPGVGR